MVYRTTKYFLQTFARDGTLVKEDLIYTQRDSDFEAWGSITGVKQKDAFHDPHGFGAFYTSLTDQLGTVSVSVSVGGTVGSNGPNGKWGTLDFFVHNNEVNAVKAKANIEDALRFRKQIDVASDVRRALSRLSESQNIVRSADLRLIGDQLSFNFPNSNNDVDVISGQQDFATVKSLVQYGGTDLLAYSANAVSDLGDIYNQIDVGRYNWNLYSVGDRSLALQIGKSFTAEYLMDFAKDAEVIPAGVYEVVDISVESVSDSDEYGNKYNDPDSLYLNIPAAEVIFYLQKIE